MAFDVDAVVGDALKAASDSLGKDIKTVSGFARSQFAAIANNAAKVVSDYGAGKITKSEADELLDEIPQLTKDTINTLTGLAEIALEKAWNAVADTVMAAARTAIGL